MTAAARKLALLSFVLSALSACSSTSKYESDPVFKEAYQQGCSTAVDFIPGDKSTIQRDDDLFSTNKAYNAGWRAGYSACKIDHPQQSNPGIPDNYQGRRNGPSGY